MNNGSRGKTRAKVCDIVVRNQKTYASIDSGSEISLINEKAINQLPKQNYKWLNYHELDLIGITGHGVKVLGFVLLKSKIENTGFREKFYVITNSTKPIILGIGFITKHKVKLDLSNHIMTIRNWIIPLKDKDTNNTVELAKMSQRTIVKPKCIMHVEVKTKSNRINGMFSTLENAPGIQDQTRVMIPRVLIPKRKTF